MKYLALLFIIACSPSYKKLSKELEAEKAKVSKLKEENEKLKECIRFYAAGDTQFDCEYVDVQGGLVFKSGSYARQLLKKV
jgi:hypothetical protein